MLCHIYRSDKKIDTYLYIVDKDDFSNIPEELLNVFGEPQFSFSFQLESGKKLSRENADDVLQNLKSQGYHLQLKSDMSVEQLLALKALN